MPLPLPQFHCGLCAEDFGSNCDPDDIRCPTCGAQLCPCCKHWFGGETPEFPDDDDEVYTVPAMED